MRIRHHAFMVHEDVDYTFARGDEVPEDTPAEVVAWLRRGGAIEGAQSQADEGAELGDGKVPDRSLDIATADAPAIAEWIKSTKPNAQETVALAGTDADLARKVLEAEDLSHGGDGRTTVKVPLQGIIDAAGSGS